MIEDIIRLEPQEFAILKTVEELAELQEVLIKLVTKPNGALEGDRLNHLIEELGDVNFRTFALIKRLGLVQEVANRRQIKLEQTHAACLERYEEVV